MTICRAGLSGALRHDPVLWLLAALAAISVLVTARAAVLSHAYLPMGDILRYADVLQNAAAGQLSWFWLLERHNGVHLILLPKLVFWLDMWLTAGSGWVVMGVSGFLILMGPIVFLQAVLPRLPWGAGDKVAFALVTVTLMTSAVQMESLANPINIQWSFLSLGILLTASAWAGTDDPKRLSRWRGLAGLLITLLSAGPLLAVVLSLAAVLGMYRFGLPGLRRVAATVLLLMAAVAVLEAINRCFVQQPPLFLWLYRGSVDAALWQSLSDAVMVAPGQAWWQWLLSFAVFGGQFLGVPFSAWLPLPLTPLVAVVWLVAVYGLCRQAACPAALRHVVCYGLAMVLLLAAMAGLVRPLMVYTLRFANIGLLFALIVWLLWFHVLQVSLRPIVRRGVPVMVALLVLLSGLGVAREFPFSMNATRAAQLAYAVGLEDTAAIVNDPNATWAENDAHDTRRFVESWRSLSLGIFASPGYQYFSAQRALPTDVVPCDYRVVVTQAPVAAVRLRGSAWDPEGDPLTNIVFLDAAGLAVGYGIPWVSRTWQGLLRKPQEWQAWLSPRGTEQAVVQAVAFDERRRCQPWPIALSAKTEQGS